MSNPLGFIVVLQVVIEPGGEIGVGDGGFWASGCSLFGSSASTTSATATSSTRSGSPFLIAGSNRFGDVIEQAFTEADQQIVLKCIARDLVNRFATRLFLAGGAPRRSGRTAVRTLDRPGATRTFPLPFPA